jgi:hypothetical protein
MTSKVAPISPENKKIARYVATVFGGTPRVHEYADRLEQLTVGILYSRDQPQEGVTAYSTIKLSDHPMKWGTGEFPIRLELTGVCANQWSSFLTFIHHNTERRRVPPGTVILVVSVNTLLQTTSSILPLSLEKRDEMLGAEQRR